MVTAVQERLRLVLGEAQGLISQGPLDKTKSAHLETLLAEGEELKGQIASAARFDSLADWGQKSAGMLPINGKTDPKAEVTAITPAGESLFGQKSKSGIGGIQLLDSYGEGRYTEGVLAKTSTDEYRNAFKSYIRKGPATELHHLRTLQEGADTSGGFLVPSDILDRVISREPTPTRVAGRVTQLPTSRDNLVIPKVVYTTDDLYTTGMRVTWTGEVPSSATVHRVTEPVFGQVSIPVFTAMMSIPITNDMIEDANFPLVSYVSGKFSETIDLLRDNMIENGTGLGQPTGILVNPGGDVNQPKVVVSTSASALTADGLVNLAFALPEQYDDNAVWIMNKTNTAAAIATLKDNDNRYLWGAGLQDSGLSVDLHNRKLLGYDVVLSGFMPNVGTSTYPIIFGDPRGYYLVNRIGFSVQVLRELYAESNQVLILGRIRFGGLTAEPWRLRIQQCHA